MTNVDLAPSPANATNAVPDIQIILRYDDVSRRSHMHIEQALLEISATVGASLLLAVIPFIDMPYPDDEAECDNIKAALDADKIALLRLGIKHGVAEIAAHGYNHQNNAKVGRSSELAGLPLETQEKLLTMAKAALDECLDDSVAVLVPPYNQYDANTLKAMKKTGYMALSAGMFGHDQLLDDIAYLPGTVYPAKLLQTVREARRRRARGVIVVTMHAYDFAESGRQLPKFREGDRQITLDRFKQDLQEILNMEGVVFASTKQLLKQKEDLSAQRFTSNRRLYKNLNFYRRYLPNLQFLFPVNGVYYPEAAARTFRSLQIVSLWIIPGFLALLGLGLFTLI